MAHRMAQNRSALESVLAPGASNRDITVTTSFVCRSSNWWKWILSYLRVVSPLFSYMEFMEKSADLNLLENYPQLMERCRVIGYEVSKVVFRGYYASPKLQEMHDHSITSRTKLKLAVGGVIKPTKVMLWNQLFFIFQIDGYKQQQQNRCNVLCVRNRVLFLHFFRMLN